MHRTVRTQLVPPRVRVVAVLAAAERAGVGAKVEQLADTVPVERRKRSRSTHGSLAALAHLATYPPSMGTRMPVMFLARSEQRKTAASAQSSAVIGRPSGWIEPADCATWSMASAGTSMPPAAMNPVYGMAPGQRAFTRMSW